MLFLPDLQENESRDAYAQHTEGKDRFQFHTLRLSVLTAALFAKRRYDHADHSSDQQYNAADQRREEPEGAEPVRDPDNDSLRNTGSSQLTDRSGFGHAKADQTDHDGNAHGDDNPDTCDSAGKLQLVFILDGHEAKQNMRHSKVAKSPGERGYDGKESIRAGAAGREAGSG